jgi:outer membrane protein OmpA-like peptidoglycan-associated protein
MKSIRILIILALLPFLSIHAQSKITKRTSALSFNISLSDYSFPKLVKDSSINKALKTNDWYKPGKMSVGIGITYWKGLAKWIDFSTSITGIFSNFPENFVKNDKVGQAKFSTQIDALFHIKMFSDKALINPFLTAGAGAGYFSRQLVAYAPLGIGFRFRCTENTFAVLQAQWRTKFTDGINNDYLFYSFSIAQSLFKRKPHTTNVPVEIIVPASPPILYPAKNIVADTTTKYSATQKTISNPEKPEIKKEIIDKVNFVAKHIYFGYASDIIEYVSYKALDEVVNILQQNPAFKLSIAAHADNNGGHERNQLWSDRRAKSVANYFHSKGINQARITYKGYGDTQPIGDNKTEAGRAQNRRVELKLKY